MLSTVWYNNWHQSSEFVVCSVTLKYEGDLFHFGLGILGIGFESFYRKGNNDPS